jgi:hypothetical protein
MEQHQAQPIAFPSLAQATAASLSALSVDQIPQAESGVYPDTTANKPVGQPTRWSTRQKLLLAACIVLVLALAITIPLLTRSSSSASSGSGNEASGSSCSNGSCSCTDGSFSRSGSACQSWSLCQQGERMVTQGTATSDRVCQPCSSGTFQNASNHVSATCQAWSPCQFLQRVSTEGNAISDQVCEPCWDKDSYSFNLLSCRACPAGTYLEDFDDYDDDDYDDDDDSSSNPRCTSCSAWRFQDAANHLETWCKPYVCHGGQYTVEGQTTHSSCLTCPVGMYLGCLSFYNLMLYF